MSTRRSKQTEPLHAKLSAEQLQSGIRRITRVIKQIESFDPESIQERFGPEQRALEAAIDGELSSVFGHGTVEYNRYRRATDLDHGGMSVNLGFNQPNPMREISQARQYVTSGKAEAIQLLNQAVKWLEYELEDVVGSTSAPTRPAEVTTSNRRVFIVHGHDVAAKESVARFLTSLDFDPVILSEQASQGRTIIEKIEAEEDVGFAVVLLTPDDVGSKSGESLRPRVRQNVLLELGYFIGKLARPRVCALVTTSDIELPTDFAGVVWQLMDQSEGWKLVLAKELKAAGYTIDANKLI